MDLTALSRTVVIDRLLVLEGEAQHLAALAAVADACAHVARERADAAQRTLSEVKVFIALLPDDAALELRAPRPDAADPAARLGVRAILPAPKSNRGVGACQTLNSSLAIGSSLRVWLRAKSALERVLLKKRQARPSLETAARQRAFRAATSSGPVAPPLAVTNDPATLHQDMRKRIAALEETIAKLPTAPEGLLNDSEIDEAKNEIATLKTLPPVPAKFPTEAAGAQSRLAKFGEMVLQRLAADEAGRAITAASKALWAQYGDQLIALARSIGDWIASLPPPP